MPRMQDAFAKYVGDLLSVCKKNDLKAGKRSEIL